MGGTTGTLRNLSITSLKEFACPDCKLTVIHAEKDHFLGFLNFLSILSCLHVTNFQ
jgi:hypothetical protein